MGAKKGFTRGAATDSPSFQHSLKYPTQARGDGDIPFNKDVQKASVNDTDIPPNCDG